jgi:hypothetical protein
VNVELALRAVELAKASPEQFDMSSFTCGWYDRDAVTKDSEDFTPPCGTTACYAGWTAYLAAPVGSEVQGSYVWEPGKSSQHVEDYAIKALGITPGQAEALFYLKGIDQVEAAVRYLADNPDADYHSLRDAADAADSE